MLSPATARENADNINNISFNSNTAIIIGSEGYGISPEIIKKCNNLIRIPMDPTVSSINAAWVMNAHISVSSLGQMELFSVFASH